MNSELVLKYNNKKIKIAAKQNSTVYLKTSGKAQNKRKRPPYNGIRTRTDAINSI